MRPPKHVVYLKSIILQKSIYEYFRIIKIILSLKERELAIREEFPISCGKKLIEN
jgi:hypothetical protein